MIEEARSLQPHELEQLRGAIDEMLATQDKPLMTEDDFELYLAAKGIASVPDRAAEPDLENEEYEPVEVTGKPLSEVIIEERR